MFSYIIVGWNSGLFFQKRGKMKEHNNKFFKKKGNLIKCMNKCQIFLLLCKQSPKKCCESFLTLRIVEGHWFELFCITCMCVVLKKYVLIFHLNRRGF